MDPLDVAHRLQLLRANFLRFVRLTHEESLHSCCRFVSSHGLHEEASWAFADIVRIRSGVERKLHFAGLPVPRQKGFLRDFELPRRDETVVDVHDVAPGDRERPAARFVVADGLLHCAGGFEGGRFEEVLEGSEAGVVRVDGVREDGIDQVQVVDGHERRHRVRCENPRCVAVDVELQQGVHKDACVNKSCSCGKEKGHLLLRIRELELRAKQCEAGNSQQSNLKLELRAKQSEVRSLQRIA